MASAGGRAPSTTGATGARGQWTVGEPLLVTSTDKRLRIYNGDTGVVIDDGNGGVTVAFDKQGEMVTIHPSQLGTRSPRRR